MVTSPLLPDTHALQQSRRPHWSLALLLSILVGIGLLFLRIAIDAQNNSPRAQFTSTERLNADIIIWYHYGSLVGIWVIAGVSGLVFWKYAWLPIPSLDATGLAVTLFFVVLGLGFSLLLCVIIAIFTPSHSLGVRTTIDTYEVSLKQRYDYDPGLVSTLLLTVIREDGAYYSVELDQLAFPEDGKTSVCTTLSIQRVEHRIYFRCNDESISQRTPYVDSYKKTVYLGWGKVVELPLNTLPFYEPYRMQCLASSTIGG